MGQDARDARAVVWLVWGSLSGLGSRLFRRVDVREGAAARLAVADDARCECEEGVVLTEAYILPRVNTRPELANENRTRRDLLAGKHLDAAALAVAVSAVA